VKRRMLEVFAKYLASSSALLFWYNDQSLGDTYVGQALMLHRVDLFQSLSSSENGFSAVLQD